MRTLNNYCLLAVVTIVVSLVLACCTNVATKTASMAEPAKTATMAEQAKTAAMVQPVRAVTPARLSPPLPPAARRVVCRAYSIGNNVYATCN